LLKNLKTNWPLTINFQMQLSWTAPKCIGPFLDQFINVCKKGSASDVHVEVSNFFWTTKQTSNWSTNYFFFGKIGFISIKMPNSSRFISNLLSQYFLQFCSYRRSKTMASPWLLVIQILKPRPGSWAVSVVLCYVLVIRF
jgi:hypothetical protein